jgi:hypothetical protein
MKLTTKIIAVLLVFGLGDKKSAKKAALSGK